MILDADTGKVVDVNPFLVQLLGILTTYYVGNIFGTSVCLKTSQHPRTLSRRCKITNISVTIICPRKTREGRPIAVEFVSNVYLVDHSKVIRCNIRDISSRKRMEEAVRKSESKYRQLYESMRDALVKVDMTGRILEFNSEYQRMLGYSDAELRRLNYHDFTPERWHAIEGRILEEQILSRGYSQVYEKEYRRRDGSVFPVELRTFLINSPSGQPEGMWAIVRDITERKQMEKALLESEQQLEQYLKDPLWHGYGGRQLPFCQGKCSFL